MVAINQTFKTYKGKVSTVRALYKIVWYLSGRLAETVEDPLTRPPQVIFVHVERCDFQRRLQRSR